MKLTKPLFSDYASGTLGTELQFANTRRGAVAGRRRRPKQPNTPAQRAARVFLAQLSQQWAGLGIAELASWIADIREDLLPPYNLFIKYNVDRYKHKPHRQYYNDVTDVFPSAAYPASLATDPAETSNNVTAGGPHEITWTYTNDVIHDDWLSIYHVATPEFGGPHWRNVVAVLPTFGPGRHSHLITGLEPGHTTIFMANVSRTGKPRLHFLSKTATVTE